MKIKYYYPPNGDYRVDEMLNINPEDEAYFTKNGYDMSIEDIGGGEIVVYARAPHDHDGEDEVMVLARGRTCEDTMKELAESCREIYGIM